MSREIKFRAWVANHNRPWMAQQGVHSEIDTPGKFLALYGDQIIMQYTGLKDRNCVEIYEGDIVRYWHDSGGYRYRGKSKRYNAIRVVEWADKSQFSGWNIARGRGEMRWEVVGNIYESPGLLTKERQGDDN